MQAPAVPPGQHLDGSQREASIDQLVETGETGPRGRAEGPREFVSLAHVEQRVAPQRFGADNRVGFWRRSQRDSSASDRQDPGLLKGNGAQGVPEYVGVVQTDRGEHGQLVCALDDVGGVVQATKPRLDYGVVDALADEQLISGSRRHLKHAGRTVGRSAHLPLRGAHVGEHLAQPRRVNRSAMYGKALQHGMCVG